jgi:hypothetical protein
VNVSNNSVIISKNRNEAENKYRVSKKGQMVLGGEAKELLMKSKARHYWLKLDDAKHQASLLPF